MIQSIWQILWLLGFSNSPGLAPFPGDLKWNPNVVCPPKDCWQIGCQHAPDTVSLLEKKCPGKWWLQPILVMHIRWMHYKGKSDRKGNNPELQKTKLDSGPDNLLHDCCACRILKWFAIPFSSGPHFVRTLHHDLSILGDPTWHSS